MYSDTQIMAQIAPYQPYLIIGAVFVLFIFLRITRRELRQRVEEIGRGLMGNNGWKLWFWLNAPGVILHELSHAIAILLFSPFGFRIKKIAFFHIKLETQRDTNGGRMGNARYQWLQLGEVRYDYNPPQPTTIVHKIIGETGKGLSGIAPLFGGIALFALLYWVATGYNLWDLPFDAQMHIQLLRPGWPWWTLIFAPYLILTVTSELWPSSQDWNSASWLVGVVIAMAVGFMIALWYFHRLNDLLVVSTSAASHINFALLILLGLDVVFLIVAEVLVRVVWR
jgi:hypothetical protein